MSRYAAAAEELLRAPLRPSTHAACNRLLARLRSGSRRRRFWELRTRLRVLRARAAEKNNSGGEKCP